MTLLISDSVLSNPQTSVFSDDFFLYVVCSLIALLLLIVGFFIRGYFYKIHALEKRVTEAEKKLGDLAKEIEHNKELIKTQIEAQIQVFSAGFSGIKADLAQIKQFLFKSKPFSDEK